MGTTGPAMTTADDSATDVLGDGLVRSDPDEPGITRKGRGRGFEYFDPVGEKITDLEVIQRIRDLAIPPAWEDVWICPDAEGHLQAVGRDDRGRRQYRYHDRWRERRAEAKFDRVLDFARTLPRLRRHCRELLEAGDEPTRDRVLAASLRLLEHGFFRVGNEQYAEENATYGLTTVRKEHVTVHSDGTVTFDYPAKGEKPRHFSLDDPLLTDVLSTLRRRRGGGDELLAWRDDAGEWHDITADDLNAEMKRLCDRDDVSAKDFRTWNATVLAAIGLAVAAQAPDSDRARQRVHRHVAGEVADYLGNTPAVARSSYIDPRLFDRFDEGLTIHEVVTDLAGARHETGEPSYHGRIEEAVLDLLDDEPASRDLVDA